MANIGKYNLLSSRPPDAEREKQTDIAEVVEMLQRLSTIQVDVVRAIIERFTEEQECELIRNDFLDEEAFEYFSMRLAAHHASSSIALKKENFEHILEQAFQRTGHQAKLTDSMTHRGADLEVDGSFYSLKTEASKGINPRAITISKLMEARWIRDLGGPEDVPDQVRTKILPHFEGYERIFTLRSYAADQGRIRYDLREIPKELLQQMGQLKASDFNALSKAGGTSAEIKLNNKRAFSLRLDGSVEKVTISGLDVQLCPLHAWWILTPPGLDRKSQLSLV